MDILRHAYREKYIDDVFYADNIVYFYGEATITLIGKEYLANNSKWAKAYKTLKEVRDWVK